MTTVAAPLTRAAKAGEPGTDRGHEALGLELHGTGLRATAPDDAP
jgi:hypothetical protein